MIKILEIQLNNFIDKTGNTAPIFVFIAGICLLSVLMISVAKRLWHPATPTNK